MAPTKRIAKKRLKEDRLVTVTVEASQWIQQYFTQVVAGVAILVVAVGAILLTAHMKRTASRDSEKEFALAMSQYNARDLDGAAGSFTRIVDKYGSHSAGEYSRYFLGKTLLAQGRYDEAMAAFEQYIQKSAEEATFREAAIMGKAQCLEGLHNYGAAADQLERLSQTLDPNDPRYAEVLFQAGQNYEKTGSQEKAIEFYRKVVDKAAGPLKDRATVAISLLE